MSKRAPYTPYLEIILTVAVMAFLVLIIAGSFNQRPDGVAQITARPD
jgi:hypothetical protein